MVNWTTGNENSNFQVGMKYIIDPVSSIKVQYNIYYLKIHDSRFTT